jgi:uncharacterized protein YidB (DUF937 family)
MGLLDGVLGNLAGSLLGGGQAQGGNDPLSAVLRQLTGGNSSQSSDLMHMAMSLVQQHGGIEGLLNMFRQSGLAQHADSWVGTGANMPLSANDLSKVVGSSTLSDIAAKLGMPVNQAGSAMAQLLPELVNHLTPQGQVTATSNDLLSQGLAMLQRGMR